MGWAAGLWTRFKIRRQSDWIGQDALGNQYYESQLFSDPFMSLPSERKRWVLYANVLADPSTVAPEWHGWLHQAVAEPPPSSSKGETSSGGNKTGTVNAHKPSFFPFGERAYSDLGEESSYERWDPSASSK